MVNRKTSTLLATLMLNLAPGIMAQVDLKAKVADELPPALARLKAASKQIRGEGSYVEDWNSGYTERGRFVFAVDGDSRKVSYGVKDVGKNIYSTSPEASFYIRRESAEDPYVVNKFGGPEEVAGPLKGKLNLFISAPYSICNVPLSEIMADPSFEIAEVSGIEFEGEDCLKIEYDYHNEEDSLASGWVIVSPDEGWAIRAFESRRPLKNRPQARYFGVVEYGDVEGGVPVLHRVQITSSNPPEEVIELSYVFDGIVPGPVPDEEFTLASYGLPDLSTPRGDSANRTVYWLYGLAALALVVALAMKSWAARLERGRTGTTP